MRPLRSSIFRVCSTKWTAKPLIAWASVPRAFDGIVGSNPAALAETILRTIARDHLEKGQTRDA